jgi:hypothetical protein
MTTKTAIFTPEIKERFRTIPSQVQYIPVGMNLNDYKIVGYLNGERLDKCATLTIEQFGTIQHVTASQNAINGKKFEHFICHNPANNKFTILVMQKK